MGIRLIKYLDATSADSLYVTAQKINEFMEWASGSGPGALAMFKYIDIQGQDATTISADTTSDTLTLIEGNSIRLTGYPGSNGIKISLADDATVKLDLLVLDDATIKDHLGVEGDVSILGTLYGGPNLNIGSPIYPQNNINFASYPDNASSYLISALGIKPRDGVFAFGIEPGSGSSMYGIQGNIRQRGAANKTNIIPLWVQCYHGWPGEGVGNAQWLGAAEFDIILQGDTTSPGTIDNLVTLDLGMTAAGLETVTTYKGISLGHSKPGGGTIGNAYGFIMGDVDFALGHNYAIYTGLGLHRFGDTVLMKGDATVVGNFRVEGTEFFGGLVIDDLEVNQDATIDGVLRVFGGLDAQCPQKSDVGYFRVTPDAQYPVEFRIQTTANGVATPSGVYFRSQSKETSITDFMGLQVHTLVSNSGVAPTNLYGAYIKAEAIDDGEPVNAIALGLEIGRDAATITNAYGLKILPINDGNTLNYAIYTGAGIIRLGDTVLMKTDATIVDDLWVGDSLRVVGTSRFDDNVLIDADLQINADATVVDDLWVGDRIYMKGQVLYIDQDAGASDSGIYFRGTGGWLWYYGTGDIRFVFNQRLLIQSSLDVQTDATVGIDLRVRNNLTVEGALDQQGQSVFGDTATFLDATILDSLRVDGEIHTPGVYGEIFVEDHDVGQTLTDTTGWYKVDAFDSTGSYSDCHIDTNSQRIVVNKAGVYMVAGSISFGGTGGRTIDFEIRVNDIALGNIRADRRLSSGGDTGSVSLSGLLPLSAGEDVSLWASANLGSTNIIIRHANITLHKIGSVS